MIAYSVDLKEHYGIRSAVLLSDYALAVKLATREGTRIEITPLCLVCDADAIAVLTDGHSEREWARRIGLVE